jgi:hypothetical protein
MDVTVDVVGTDIDMAAQNLLGQWNAGPSAI